MSMHMRRAELFILFERLGFEIGVFKTALSSRLFIVVRTIRMIWGKRIKFLIVHCRLSDSDSDSMHGISPWTYDTY